MSDRVDFALPDITEEEIEAVVSVMRSGWLTTGAECAEFEKEFAKAVDVDHAVAVNSCTAALHLSLEALGVAAGDLVYVPSYTFAASAEVVRYLGARPVLVDVDPATSNLNPAALRRAIADSSARGEPRAVMPVHFAGVACEMDEIWQIAREHGLAVVEDAAHAFPAAYRDEPVGRSPSDVRSTACFSFYATKTITTGEGGMVVTDDPDLADRMRMMSLHGLSKQAWNRYSGGTWRYDIVAPGFKYNLNDMAAALGRVQLRRAEEMRARRADIAARYDASFTGLRGVSCPLVPEGCRSSWHLYVLRLTGSAIESKRDELIDALKRDGIGVSMHFIPLHLHSYYRETYGLTPGDLPVSDDAYRRSLSLPFHSGMTDEQVDRVIEKVRHHAGRILG